jgi:hypothetical protein
MFPVAHIKHEWRSDYQARFSDACLALEEDGWTEYRINPPCSTSKVPLLFMRPEWDRPIVSTVDDLHPESAKALYWKPTGIAKERGL